MTLPLEETMARAICEGFWEGARKPEAWSEISERERNTFRNCARHALDAAKRYKVEKARAA